MRSSFIKGLIKYLLTRNVRVQSRRLPSGMGQWRQGTVKTIKRKSTADPLAVPRADQAMGGGRIFTPSGGGRSKFLTAGSKVYPTRATKIGATGAGAGVVALGAGLYEKEKTPSGAATVGERQFNAVTKTSGGAKTRGLSVAAIPQLRKRSKAYMTRTKMRGGTVVSAKPYKALKFAKDITKMSKSGYHKYRPGSAGAKSFQAAHKAAGGKKFKWEGTGKWYSGA